MNVFNEFFLLFFRDNKTAQVIFTGINKSAIILCQQKSDPLFSCHSALVSYHRRLKTALLEAFLYIHIKIATGTATAFIIINTHWLFERKEVWYRPRLQTQNAESNWEYSFVGKHKVDTFLRAYSYGP